MDNLKITKLAVKIQKIARLAFNPAAAEGESASAASKILQIARKNNIDFDGFKILLGVTTTASNLNSPNSPVHMTFGKYEDKTLDEVFQCDPDYLIWVLKEVTGRAQLKNQITEFLKTKQLFSSTQGVLPTSKASYWESYCIAKCTCLVDGPCGSMGQMKGKRI